jgi:type I restriction enzyme M protein
MLTNVDEQGKTFASQLPEEATGLKLAAVKLENGARTLTQFVITEFDESRFDSLSEAYEQDVKPFVGSLDYKEQPLRVMTSEAMYWFDAERETLVKEALGKQEELGCGKMVVKVVLKKKTKTLPERMEITVEPVPDYQKDYEIIPFRRDDEAIVAFMARYITKPFEYLENVVGVELNFNKVFYKPEKLRSVEEILGEIALLDAALRDLEEEIVL